MAATALAKLLSYLGRTLRGQCRAAVTDIDLLYRFAQQRDESAFEELLHRHAAMVLGVCQRTLGNEVDAEDAFQATFLVLVRKAHAIRPPTRVGNWLHGVALRTSLEARRASARRRTKEAQAMPRTAKEDASPELREVLDEELARLPAKYCEAIVLCDLEGRTGAAAAQQLGCAEGTVASRLSRGRAMLARRLTRRGLGLSLAGLTAMLAEQSVGASVSRNLLAGTWKAAILLNAGEALDTVVSVKVAALMEGVLKSMLFSNLKIGTALIATCLLLGGLGLAAYQSKTGPGDAAPQAKAQDKLEPPAKAQERKQEQKRLLDLQGDPLPDGAIARLGSRRWLHDSVVQFAAFLPDGNSVVTFCFDKTIRVWEYPSGKEIRRMPATYDKADSPRWECYALSQDGKIIATTGQAEIFFHEVATGKQLPALKWQFKNPGQAPLSPV